VSEDDRASESSTVSTSVPATSQHKAANSFFRASFGVDCGLGSGDKDEDIAFSDLKALEEESESDNNTDEVESDWEDNLELQQCLLDMANEHKDDLKDKDWLPPVPQKKKQIEGKYTLITYF
jgi:hypothetical protein